jgi:hypothetical protein
MHLDSGKSISRGFHASWCGIVILALLILAGCSQVKYYPYSFDRDSAPNVKRVAVAPWNLLSAEPSYVKGKETYISDALISYLNDHSVATKPCEATRAIWTEEKKRVGGIYDSNEGLVDVKKFRAAISETVTRVCMTEEVGGVVFPEIVVRQAELGGNTVSWDGTIERIDMSRGFASVFGNNFTFTGGSNALSLSILIIDRNNRVVLRNVAGIEHPFEAVSEDAKLKWKVRKDLLADKDKIHHALAIGFHPLIPCADYPEKPVFSKEGKGGS